MTEINEAVPTNVMFDWLIDWMGFNATFVKNIVENQNPYNMHTFSVGTNCLQNIKGLAQKL